MVTAWTAHLNHHSHSDIALIFPLSARCLPPQLKAPNPILWPADAFACILIQRLVMVVGEEKLALYTTDKQKLLVLSLEQPDSNG